MSAIYELNEIERLRAELEKANTPFNDADPRIKVSKSTNHYGYTIDGGSYTAPYATWREAYRAAEGYLFLAELERVKAERERYFKRLGGLDAGLLAPEQVKPLVEALLETWRWCWDENGDDIDGDMIKRAVDHARSLGLIKEGE